MSKSNITKEEIKIAKEAAYKKYLDLVQQYNEMCTQSCNIENYIESSYDDISVFAKVICIGGTGVDVVMVDTDNPSITTETLSYLSLEENYVASTKEKFEKAFNWAVNNLKETINE